MRITEVRVKMVGEDSERLRAFCSVTIDDAFVIRDLKVIDGDEGPFVAMPSRKMSDHCAKCGEKNHLRARFCNECGSRLNVNRAPRDEAGRVKLYADVAHPINTESREMIQEAVIAAFNDELALSLEPGYAADDDDELDFEDVEETGFDSLIAELRRPDVEDEDDARESAPKVRPAKASADVGDDRRSSRRRRTRESKEPERSGAEGNANRVSKRPRVDEARREEPSASRVEEPSDDDDGFAAGLDWSPEPAKTRRMTTRDHADERFEPNIPRESECRDPKPSDHRRTDSADQARTSEVIPSDDDFASGIFS